MTENGAKKILNSILPKESIEGKEFLSYLYYDKDGYIISSNNFVLGALKCDFDKKKNGKCEDKNGKINNEVKFPMWGHLFRGKSFNSANIDYDKIDRIIDICKEKIKKLPKTKYDLPPQSCEMIKFGKVYFNIRHFEKFIKIAKAIKASEFVYGANDDRMMVATKDGKAVINPIIWYTKENFIEEPIDYFEWKEEKITHKKEIKETKTKKSIKTKKDGKK